MDPDRGGGGMTHERGWPWGEQEEERISPELPEDREQQGMDFPSPDPWRSDDGSTAEAPAAGPMSDPAVMEKQEETRQRVASAKKSAATRKRSAAKRTGRKTTARKSTARTTTRKSP